MTFQIDLTQIIVAVIGLVATIVSVYVIPLLKSKVGNDKWDQLMKVASVAVDAAEQLGITGKVNDKFEYAATQVKLVCEKQGLKYDDETIRVAIEAAVLLLKQNKEIAAGNTITVNVPKEKHNEFT